MSIFFYHSDQPFVCRNCDGDVVFDARDFVRIHFTKIKWMFSTTLTTFCDVMSILVLLHSVLYTSIYIGTYHPDAFSNIEILACFSLFGAFLSASISLGVLIYKRYIIRSVERSLQSVVHNHSAEKHSEYWMSEKIEEMLTNVCGYLNLTDPYVQRPSYKQMITKVYSGTRLTICIIAVVISALIASIQISRTDDMISAIKRHRDTNIAEIYSYMQRTDSIYFKPADIFVDNIKFDNYLELKEKERIETEDKKFSKQPAT